MGCFISSSFAFNGCCYNVLFYILIAQFCLDSTVWPDEDRWSVVCKTFVAWNHVHWTNPKKECKAWILVYQKAALWSGYLAVWGCVSQQIGNEWGFISIIIVVIVFLVNIKDISNLIYIYLLYLKLNYYKNITPQWKTVGNVRN